MRLVARVPAALFLLLAGTSLAWADKAPAFIGHFTDFNSPAWRSSWGMIPDTLICNISQGKAPCNWGYQNLKAVADPTTPGGGAALEVTYPAPSGPPSCGCGLGGAQIYQDLKTNGHAALVASPSVGLKYHYKFPVGFDFGKNTAGKMPGLYGGTPGCASGGQRCDGGWSTRYMWRGGGQASPNGEVYWYSASGSGFGADLGVGSWKFKADGQWHSIEQLINTSTGKIIIWHDGTMVFETTQKFPGPVTGIMFSTFHGGQDTSWSPSKKTAAQFALFTVSTDGPQLAVTTPPAGNDAGAVDAGTADAGGGGSGGSGNGIPGTPGTGGSSESGSGGVVATGGASGSGGSVGGSGGGNTASGGAPSGMGTGGASAMSGEDPAPSPWGCRVGGASFPGAGGLAGVVLVVSLVARRRRRRG